MLANAVPDADSQIVGTAIDGDPAPALGYALQLPQERSHFRTWARQGDTGTGPALHNGCCLEAVLVLDLNSIGTLQNGLGRKPIKSARLLGSHQLDCNKPFRSAQGFDD